MGYLCAQLGTRTAATGLAPPPRPSDTRDRRCIALYSGGQTDQRPKTEQLALRTRESDQFWTGRPVESLMDGDEEDAMLEEIQVSTLNHASASFLIIRLTRYFCRNFL